MQESDHVIPPSEHQIAFSKIAPMHMSQAICVLRVECGHLQSAHSCNEAVTTAL